MNARTYTTLTMLFGLTIMTTTMAYAADHIALGLGRVTVVRASEAIATVAVGDPTVADVALEGDRSVMIFGKSPGQTELVLMSHGHRAILKQRIIVGTMGSEDTIIVRRPGADGVQHEAWFCAPGCAKVGGGAPK